MREFSLVRQLSKPDARDPDVGEKGRWEPLFQQNSLANRPFSHSVKRQPAAAPSSRSGKAKTEGQTAQFSIPKKAV